MLLKTCSQPIFKNVVNVCINNQRVTLFVPCVTVVGWNLLSYVVVNPLFIVTPALVPGNTLHRIFIKKRLVLGTLWIAACNTTRFIHLVILKLKKKSEKNKSDKLKYKTCPTRVVSKLQNWRFTKNQDANSS